MANVVSVLYSAAVIGAAYALMASGLTLIWGGLKFLNLAHGALYTAGGFAAYWLVTQNNLPAWLGLICGFLVAGALNLVLYVVFYRRLLRQPHAATSTLMAGVGAAIALQAWFTIKNPRDLALDPLIGGGFKLPAGVPATWEGVCIVVISLLTLGLLSLFFSRSVYGIQVRAVASNREGAEISGIQTGWVFLLVMIVSGGLAGLSGVMLGSFYFVSASSGFTAVIFGLIVTILGGLGSLGGTIAGAFIVGLVQSAVSFWLGSQWSLPILFIALMLFLVVRPQGLAGNVSFEVD
jgi:branched-chain amino acid transport system permease protein